ncbi:MAG: hypothetical protein IPJ20_19635 [Flammeovirgaceae bacterium]|nr:hypothetical protein [Flammeovirgaceae bacterium]
MQNIENKQLLNTLRQAGINSVSDLLKLSQPELITLRGIGINRFKKISPLISRLKRAIIIFNKIKNGKNYI